MDRATFLKILALGAVIPSDARRLLGQVGITPITDSMLKATDPALLNHLGRVGVDKDYVEFSNDYGTLTYVSKKGNQRRNYYSKRYRDLVTGRHVHVCSGLPMCRHDGTRLAPGWERGNNKYYALTNIFDGEVSDSGRIAISPLNDQPNGTLAGEVLVWQPRLYLGNVEIEPMDRPTLLEADPVNPNYRNNVLLWDYGICKRRVRAIEGRLRERWVFTSNPGADVRIVHNHMGRRLKLGEFAVDDDVEFVPLKVFEEAKYPLEISAGETFYPDADPEANSVDGYFYHYENGLAWNVLHDAEAAKLVYDDGTSGNFGVFNYNNEGGWWIIRRTFILFDTSSLGGEATSATLYARSHTKQDAMSISPTANVFSSNPASNTALVAEDFDQVGSTPFSSDISYDDWDADDNGYDNSFPFNSSGLAAIDDGGVSKFSLLESTYDAPDSEPSPSVWDKLGSEFACRMAEQGTGSKPKLVVNESPPAGISVIVDAKDGASDLSKVDGADVADISKIDNRPE